MPEETTPLDESCPVAKQLEKCDWHDRRKDHMEWCHEVDRRLDEGAATMSGLHSAIAENTAETKNIKADTRELVALLNSFKGAFRVLELIGKAARPLGYIAALVGSVLGIVSIFKGGGGPTP